MLLATRCPHCETVFRLRQDHLTLHGGLVRCGQCQQVFDAASSLVEPEPLLEAAARAADGPTAPPPSPGAHDVAHPEPARDATRPAGPPSVDNDADPLADTGDAPARHTPAAAPAEHASSPAPAEARFDTPAHDPAVIRPTIDETSAPGTAGAHAETTAPVADAPAPAAPAPDADAPASHDDAPAVEHAAAPDVPLIPDAPAPVAHEPARPAPPPVVIPSHPFATTESAASSDPQGFAPGAWDMWAPWLDGGIDPALQHSGANVSTAPLVPLALPDRSGPGPDGGNAVARFSGEPTPFVAAEPEHTKPDPLPAKVEHKHEHESAAPTALEPTLAATAAPVAALDGAHREPSFASPAEVPFAVTPADDAREHFAMTRETRAPQRRGGFLRVLGGFVIGLALTLALLLLAQLAWWQREKAMVYWPASQTLFARACETLGCHVAPPRAIDGLRLDASDLRQLDGPHVLELKVPLTNHYSVALAYPAIELTLLDEANRVAVRRVLAPRDYVHPGASIDAGIPAGATQIMVVRIETGDVTASNFRVQIFYP